MLYSFFGEERDMNVVDSGSSSGAPRRARQPWPRSTTAATRHYAGVPSAAWLPRRTSPIACATWRPCHVVVPSCAGCRSDRQVLQPRAPARRDGLRVDDGAVQAARCSSAKSTNHHCRSLIVLLSYSELVRERRFAGHAVKVLRILGLLAPSLCVLCTPVVRERVLKGAPR